MTPDINSTEQIFRDFDQIPFLYIVILLATSMILISLVKRAIPALASVLPPRFNHTLLPLIPILKLLIITVGLLLFIPTLVKPSMQNFIAVLGAAGLAIGFAFKDFASSLIAGIVALYEQPYRVGDRVEINGVYGEVKAINLRSLKLITPDDNAVTIPHNCIWNSSVQNANDGFREQQCSAMFFLLPEHDAIKVRQILRDVALVSPYTQFSKPVKVSLRDFPWGTQYRIRAYPIDGRDEFSFITDLTTRGKAALTDAGFGFARLPVVASKD